MEDQQCICHSHLLWWWVWLKTFLKILKGNTIICKIRHRADDEENNRTVQKYSLRTGVFEYDKWQNVNVGDIIRIANK